MAEIRYVTIPKDIIVIVEGVKDSATFTFWNFVKGRTKDASFGKDLDGVLMAMAVRQQFMGEAVGEVVGLELDQWEALCASVRSPSDGYNPEVMSQLLPFARAILDAPSQDPRPKALAPEDA